MHQSLDGIWRCLQHFKPHGFRIIFTWDYHGGAQDGEEEDALDAFMAAEILPEVTAAQQAERAAKEQERLERAKALAVCAIS